MKISLASESLVRVKTDLLALGVRCGKAAKDPNVRRLDQAMSGALLQHMKDEGFKGEADEVLKVPASGKVAARWIVLVGLGTGRPTPRDGVAVGVAGARAARKQRSLVVVASGDEPHAVRAAVEGAVTGAYRYDRYLTGPRKPKGGLSRASVLVSRRPRKALSAAAVAGQAVGEAINLARDLVNGPPNDVHPPALASAASSAARAAGAKCTVWNKARIQKEGMHLLLAVNRGSGVEPRVAHMSWTPTRPKARVVFVGKGLTFDSGGLCLKPAKPMADMKCDMAGAATTIGIVAAAAKLRLPVEVHGIIGSTENMGGDHAYRPGDIFPSRDGKTVEIVNTDAEGRLVLADVLAYARGLEPDYMIDHATLTGACMVALGRWTAGLFANDEGLAKRYAAAADSVGESYWRMPLSESLGDSLKSDIADLKHTGDTYGGAITASLFLQHFVGHTKWAHCDIAGPALLDRAHGVLPKGGTGFGVATGVAFLESLAGR